MSQDSAFDASIPVLTEVVADPAPPAAPTAAPAVAHETAPITTGATPNVLETPEVLERRAIDRWSGEQWSVMERRLSDRILQQLQGRIDFVLEQRLRDGIAEAVDKAMKGFSADIRGSLNETLGEVVARAVSQEIAHLRTLGK